VNAEARHARERQLRSAGNSFIAQGKVDDAYAKFQELARIAPNSPANNEMLHKLDAIRQQSQATKAQLEQAKEKFNEGLSLYNSQKYGEAIKAFEESFHLNPSSDETANYLKFAQQADDLARREKQQQKQQQAFTQTNGPRPPAVVPTVTHGPTTTTTAATTAGLPAKLTTVVNANVTDGYVMVKAGSQVLAYEQLSEEQTRFFRKRRVPRAVNVTKELTPANTDLEVWFVIQSLGVSEHKVFRQNFQPGAAHTLTVNFDPQSKRVEYHLN
jgi:tetratricopeptide (TPR) repeat protein